MTAKVTHYVNELIAYHSKKEDTGNFLYHDQHPLLHLFLLLSYSPTLATGMDEIGPLCARL